MAKLNVEKSMLLHKEASTVLPAGVSSNARLWQRVCSIMAPCSIFVDRAQGSHIWDVDGNEYIDYRLGFGPVILGHSYPAIHDRVHAVDERGLVYALSHELEIKVAKKIRSMVPCAEMIRFSNSGTEATMHALRVARAYTGRKKIVKFEGMYHGAHDYLLFSVEPPFEELTENHQKPLPSSQGIPEEISELVIVQRFNDFKGIEKTVKTHGKQIAAIITEPVMGNCAGIVPKEGYLEHLRELCDKFGILLIFDEVKTGFRLARGGAQELFGVVPDVACFAKSLGNGYPVAAIAGRKDVMEIIGPQRVVHGGTYSSNPISLTAADATLDLLSDGRVYDYLNDYGRKLMKGIEGSLRDAGLSFTLQGLPPMFQFLFTKLEQVHEYRDLSKADFDKYGRLQLELLSKGIMIDEDNMEVCFTSYSHTNEDLENTISAFAEASRDIARQ